MKLTNPFGRTVDKQANAIEPRGCTCSSGSASARYPGLCIVCGCSCDHGI